MPCNLPVFNKKTSCVHEHSIIQLALLYSPCLSTALHHAHQVCIQEKMPWLPSVTQLSVANVLRLQNVRSFASEISVEIVGLRLAGQSFGDVRSSRKLLCLHGWMDNAASHSVTAPAYAAAGWHVISLDLPGHGRSGHRHIADTYSGGNHAISVLEAVRKLGWHKTGFALCGHSMGAGVAGLVAGSVPESVTAFIALEGIGMNTKSDELAPQALEGAFLSRLKLQGKTVKRYASVEAAARARMRTVERYPGFQSLSPPAAATLVGRGTAPLTTDPSALPGTVIFTHDPRLLEPSPTYLTDPGMRSVLSRIRCPVLMVTGTRGWPWPEGMMAGRACSLADGELHHLAGGHHLHLDPGTAQEVAAIALDFLGRREGTIERRRRTVVKGSFGADGGADGEGGEGVQHVLPTSDEDPIAAAAAAAVVDEEGGVSGRSLSKAVELGFMPSNSCTVTQAQAQDGARSLDGHGRSPAVWGPRHIFTACTLPATTPGALPTDTPHLCVHAYPQVLSVTRSVTRSEWMDLEGRCPDETAGLRVAEDAAALVWERASHELTGEPRAFRVGAGLASPQLGAWIPAVYRDTTPTLEGVTERSREAR